MSARVQPPAPVVPALWQDDAMADRHERLPVAQAGLVIVVLSAVLWAGLWKAATLVLALVG